MTERCTVQGSLSAEPLREVTLEDVILLRSLSPMELLST